MGGVIVPYDFGRFGFREMTECGAAMRTLGHSMSSMEDAAGELVRFVYTSFVTPGTRESACALVRLYKTHPYAGLEPELKQFADACLTDGKPDANTKCLTLLATAGDKPEWTDRRRSVGHQAIPLLSADAVKRLPMVARLVQQFGAELAEVVGEGNLMLDATQRSYNVFHVEDAKGSPFIPAQDAFVQAHDIRSVLGVGGVLPAGNLFAMILFAKTHISVATAELFKTLALNVKMALLPHERQVFRS
jgi:hypothetical protein